MEEQHHPFGPFEHAADPAGAEAFATYLASRNEPAPSPADFAGLQALVQNPLKYHFYLHDSQVSEKNTPMPPV